MREGTCERATNETNVMAAVNLDKEGASRINTGIGFLNHMLELFAFRAGVTLTVECEGDLEVDGHHTTEDAGIALGMAVRSALGGKEGINRYGHALIPMDESLASCVVDISGRPYLVFNASFPSEKTGDFETELTQEFLRAFAFNAGITLHVNLLYGNNTHHMIEAIFKALGASFKQAVKINGEGIPSTKGTL